MDPLKAFDQRGESAFAQQGEALQQALAIYQQNRQGVTQRAVELTYPLSQTLLGPEHFGPMARAFCHQVEVPRDLNKIGETLLPWLLSQPSGLALCQDFPFLPTLLRYEWAFHRAYYAPNAYPLSLADCDAWLQSPQGQPPWRCHPSLSLLTSRYPLMEIVQCLKALQRGETAELVIDRQPRQTWAIWPSLDAVEQALVTHEQRQLLNWLRRPNPQSLTPALFAPMPELLARGWLAARDN
ncbi:HvfC/BufC family peptide modification chaperone [Ferrimonas marina]|uniref:Putative DNA-binding domain-containing protein n=1 Tax=Ferrimonas marina TaxID=299255 RepID=A0A1M5P0Q1_9GAMM|nr:putative DNA-binding domain-containing protein [Ferrimonas marina]SHG95285.1 Putative DNA-binding domain-containing protein [Ferrimonas marina]